MVTINRGSYLMVKGTIFSKFKGDRAPLPALPPLRSVALAWLGGVLAIATVGKLAGLLSMPLMLGSFGASCVLVFGYPDVPFSQPRNVVFGHFLSSLIGLAFLTVCGPQWWAMGLATGTAIAVMMLTRNVHPPAGSNPVIVFLSTELGISSVSNSRRSFINYSHSVTLQQRDQRTREISEVLVIQRLSHPYYVS